MSKHYTKEELELYRNGEMSILGRIACTVHLENCPECANRLNELKEDDELIKELRSSVQLFDELSKMEQKREQNAAAKPAKSPERASAN